MWVVLIKHTHTHTQRPNGTGQVDGPTDRNDSQSVPRTTPVDARDTRQMRSNSALCQLRMQTHVSGPDHDRPVFVNI